MSRQNTDPVVVLVVAKDHQIIKQTYKNIMYVENNDSAPWPLFFNDILNQRRGHLLICLGDYKPVNYKYVEEVVKVYIKYPNAIGAIYTDTDLEIFPSFQPNRLVNPPLAINGAISGKLFDVRLQELYYFDVLRKLNNSAILYHIPKRLIIGKKINNIHDMEILTNAERQTN